MTTSRLLAGASGYSFKEWKGTFYRGLETGGHATVVFRTAADGRDQQHVLPDAEGHGPRKLGGDDARRLPVFNQGIAADHTHFTPQSGVGNGTARVSLPESGGARYTLRGPVLFQLPPNLKKDLPRLSAFLALLPEDHNAAFEFRNDTWFADEVYDALKGAGAALCLSEREDNAPPPLVSTAPWGYVRLRLEEYSDNDLKEWARKLKQLSGAKSSSISCTTDGACVCAGCGPGPGHDERNPAGDDCVDDAIRVSGPCTGHRCARMLRHGARRRRRHGASVHGELREPSRRARRRHVSLPVSVHGARLETSGLSQARPRHRACCGDGDIAPQARCRLVRGRKILRRPHDVASAGRIAVAGSAGTRVRRISAASARATFRRARRASCQGASSMLFLQGTRDEFADLQLLTAVVERLRSRARLKLFEDADHSFHVPARTGHKDSQVRLELASATAAWIAATAMAPETRGII